MNTNFNLSSLPIMPISQFMAICVTDTLAIQLAVDIFRDYKKGNPINASKLLGLSATAITASAAAFYAGGTIAIAAVCTAAIIILANQVLGTNPKNLIKLIAFGSLILAPIGLIYRNEELKKEKYKTKINELCNRIKEILKTETFDKSAVWFRVSPTAKSLIELSCKFFDHSFAEDTDGILLCSLLKQKVRCACSYDLGKEVRDNLIETLALIYVTKWMPFEKDQKSTTPREAQVNAMLTACSNIQNYLLNKPIDSRPSQNKSLIQEIIAKIDALEI